MPSPAFVDCDQYGVDAWDSAGDWPTSRTLAAPSFSAEMCLVVLVADYVHAPSGNPNFDHWAVPASWESLGRFGTSAASGLGSVTYIIGEVFWCLPAQVASTVRPERSDNALFVPSTGASSSLNYWRAFVTGWTPAKRFDWDGVDNIQTGQAAPSASTLPSGGWGLTVIAGVGEGTFIQFGAGNLAYGGGPTGVDTANGFTEDYVAGHFRVASRAYSSDVTTTPLVWTRPSGAWRLGATAVIALDLRMRRGGRHLGLVRGSRGVG